MSNFKQLEEEKKKVGTWGHLNKSRLKATLKYAGKRVLDAGCSTGTYVNYLCDHGYDAYGFDVLSDEHWDGKYGDRFKIGNIYHIPHDDGSFDTIFAFEILEHLEDPDIAIRELWRVTKKNIIVTVPNCSQPEVFQRSGLAFHHWVDRTHKQAFVEATLKDKLVENGFSIETVEYINPVTPEMLFLSCWYFPKKVYEFIGKVVNRIPFRKKYYMTLLMVATKREK